MTHLAIRNESLDTSASRPQYFEKNLFLNSPMAKLLMFCHDRPLRITYIVTKLYSTDARKKRSDYYIPSHNFPGPLHNELHVGVSNLVSVDICIICNVLYLVLASTG